MASRSVPSADIVDPRRILAERLRTLRALSGKSLRDLEQFTHASDSALSRYLNGKVVPPWAVVVGLCRAVDRDPRRLRALWQRAAQAAAAEAASPAPSVPPRMPAASKGSAASDPAVASSPAASARNLLPADTPALVGRESELDRLLAACQADIAAGRPGVCSIDGMPGVGKTAFALHAARRLAASFPDGQIFLALHGHTSGVCSVEPADALTALLIGLGVAAGQVPEAPAARAALWREHVAGRRVLLVLDDARGSEQIRPLLPRTPGSLVLVTSRRRLLMLDDAVPFSLDVLTEQGAGELFVAKCGRPGLTPDDPLVREVVRRCGRLPLAVHLTAARLRHRPAWDLGSLVADLGAGQDRLAALSGEEVTVAATFEASYRGLGTEAQLLFRRLGLLPGDDIDAPAAAALSGFAPARARRLLEELADHHMIEERSRGRHRMHDLIREHAQALAGKDDPTANDAALDRLLDHYVTAATRADSLLSAPVLPQPSTDAACLCPDLTSEGDARAWLSTEYGNLRAAFEFARTRGRARPAVDLAAALHEFLRCAGHLQELEYVARTALGVAKSLCDDSRLGRALFQYGVAKRYTDGYAAAEAAVGQALELSD